MHARSTRDRLPSRNKQVRTHAQKLLLRQQKEQAGVMQISQNGRDLPPLPANMPPSSAALGGSNALGMLPSDSGAEGGTLGVDDGGTLGVDGGATLSVDGGALGAEAGLIGELADGPKLDDGGNPVGEA